MIFVFLSWIFRGISPPPPTHLALCRVEGVKVSKPAVRPAADNSRWKVGPRRRGIRVDRRKRGVVGRPLRASWEPGAFYDRHRARRHGLGEGLFPPHVRHEPVLDDEGVHEAHVERDGRRGDVRDAAVPPSKLWWKQGQLAQEHRRTQLSFLLGRKCGPR